MTKEELFYSYRESDLQGKWVLIKQAVTQNLKELYPLKSDEYLGYARKEKQDALNQKEYFKIIWHYWLRRIPVLAPAAGKKYLSPKYKEYYTYKTWYYEFLEAIIDIRENLINYEKVFKLLADEKSKEIFCDILMARIMKTDIFFSEAYLKSKDYEQYFALVILPPAESTSIFVDCGGYIGDTAEKFIKNYTSNYKAIYIYEPDRKNALCAEKNLEYYKNIYIRECGVGACNRIAYFNSMGNSSSSVQKKGTEVQIVSLDNDIKEKITFIKMDIEGEEGNAIAGAVHHIQEDKPVCAICLYHKTQDIWKLPLLILEINSEYHLYLRHYRENAMESVAYFV